MKYRHTLRNICLYFVFSQVHFIEFGILSPKHCNPVLLYNVSKQKKAEKINTLATNCIYFLAFYYTFI